MQYMHEATTVVLAILGAVLGAFVLHEIVLFFASIVYWRRQPRQVASVPAKARFAVIVPAHNEELLIGDVVDSIERSEYPSALRETLVIADNCNDGTAAIARARGAKVFERNDSVKRGKPYALQWLLQQIDLNRYDAFVIIDADTVVDPRFFAAMNASLSRGNKVIQGYFGVMNPDESWLTRLSILPGVLKYKLQYPGKMLFGHSCPLTGNGMCFAAEIFKRYGWNAFSIAENWEYYIKLTLDGWVVTSATDATIYSQVTPQLRTARTQRMRWTKGRITTLQQYWKPLLRGSFGRDGGVKFDALLELARPSHSMLLIWSLLFCALSAGLLSLGWASTAWLWAALAILGSQFMFFLSGLIVQRAPLRTWMALFMVPPYLAWKLSVSAAAMVGLRDLRWV
jgi:cellulose synthase/poly-beta-1,6-N-acetylglucosamine synthase-like glycosyltransferase